jgi:hypothetical protein
MDPPPPPINGRHHQDLDGESLVRKISHLSRADLANLIKTVAQQQQQRRRLLEGASRQLQEIGEVQL